MQIHNINWITHFRRTGILAIFAILSIIYFIYQLINQERKLAVITFIFGVLIFTVEYFINAFVIKQIIIDTNQIRYKYLFSSKTLEVNFDKISHFCYYNRPVEKSNHMPYLEIYLKTNYRNLNRMRLDLCLSKHDRYLLLSRLYRKGFQVTLFDSLRQIQESEYYIIEPEERITTPNTLQ